MRSNERPKPVTLPLGLKIFRNHSRGIAQALRDAVKMEIVSFKVVPFEGDATLTDVVNEMRELKAAIDRQTIFTALPAIHTSDEMSRVGWTADLIKNYLGDEDSQSESEVEIAGNGESVEDQEVPDAAAASEIPF